ncbi:MAG TPA: hypothetical protein VF164_09490 [Trueperaceae bacterium]
MARRRDSAEPTLTLAQAAEVLGVTEGALVELVVEAGVAPRGSSSAGLMFEAADVRAVLAEREKRERLNRQELEKLGAALEDADL